MLALQSMLLQEVGEKVLLLPAWPQSWDVSFRLHAGGGTVVTGAVRGGQVVDLDVEPAARQVVVIGPPPG